MNGGRRSFLSRMCQDLTFLCPLPSHVYDAFAFYVSQIGSDGQQKRSHYNEAIYAEDVPQHV